jgi:hypothetical protein
MMEGRMILMYNFEILVARLNKSSNVLMLQNSNVVEKILWFKKLLCLNNLSFTVNYNL